MKLIGYVRVSTEKQGHSGLGLEAQMTAIKQYAAQHSGELVKVYREVESGTRADRPELAKAIQHVKRLRGKLVIAKLDRLARNVHFVSGLSNAKVDFVACDNEHANKLTIHILAAVAENEAEMTSQRTKAALTAAKARGTLLGSSRPGHWKGREDRRQAGAIKGGQAAKAKFAQQSLPVYLPAIKVARELHDEGESLQGIADKLNEQGMTTVRGCAWGPVQVSRLLASGLAASLSVWPVGLGT